MNAKELAALKAAHKGGEHLVETLKGEPETHPPKPVKKKKAPSTKKRWKVIKPWTWFDGEVHTYADVHERMNR